MNFIFNAVMRAFSSDLAIDLGTANTLVCTKGEGIRHTTLSTLIFLLDPPSKNEFLSFTSAVEEVCHTRGLVRGIILGAIFLCSQ